VAQNKRRFTGKSGNPNPRSLREWYAYAPAWSGVSSGPAYLTGTPTSFVRFFPFFLVFSWFLLVSRQFCFCVVFIKIWFLFQFHFYSNSKFVLVWNLFWFQKLFWFKNCLFLKIVQIQKLFRFKNCLFLKKKIKFKNCFNSKICSFFKTDQIKNCTNSRIVHIQKKSIFELFNFENCLFLKSIQFWKIFQLKSNRKKEKGTKRGCTYHWARLNWPNLETAGADHSREGRDIAHPRRKARHYNKQCTKIC
jgi:hypothetical protein